MAMLPDQPVLVGRDRERQILIDALDRAIAGRGSLVLISGEAGIGKTTLVDDLILRARGQGALVFAGSCYDLTTTPPYGPWVEILATYPANENLPPLPDQLRVGGGMAGIDSQAALFELAGRFLSGVAAVQPLLLVLEDLHWADPASLDLLRYLARGVRGQSILLVATYRDDEIARDHPLAALLPALIREGQARRIELQRLDREAVLAIVRKRYRLSAADEARLLAHLGSLAEGNPFFVHELLLTLEGQRVLAPVAGGWRLDDLAGVEVPPLIQQVIDGRLARLGVDTRGLLGLASVIGYDVPLDLLSELHAGPEDELDAALRQASEHHLFQAASNQLSLRFSHALVRQAIYEKVPVIRKQRLHRRLGELLAARSRPDPAAVASHFYEASDDRALKWLLQAAGQAQRLFAPEAVIADCGRAVSLAERLDFNLPLEHYRLRGLARESVGDFDGAREDHELVLEHARQRGDQHAEWQELLDLASLWASRDYQQMRVHSERAVDLARAMGDPAALGHSLNQLGNWHANAEQPANALPYHEEALEIFEDLGDAEGKARTLDLFGMSCALQGDMPRASRYFSQAAPILRQLEDQHALQSCLANLPVASWGGWVWRIVRYPEPDLPAPDAKAALSESLNIARTIGSRSGVAYTVTAMGTQAASRGELRSAFEYFSAGLREAEDIQHHLWVSQCHGNLGQTLVDLLIADRARLHLQAALDVAGQTGSANFKATAAGLLGMAIIQQKHFADAGSLLDQYVDLSTQPAMSSDRQCWFAYAELALAERRDEEALEIIDRLIASVPNGPGPLSPYMTRLRGEILLASGQFDEADRQLAESHEDALELGFPLIRWRILATQCKLHRAQGRIDDAGIAGQAALEIVNELAGELDDDDLRATFLTNALTQISGAVPYVPDRSANYAGLTPREIEVLQAIADGLTDAEAGERLFIATRTVSQHLRSVYNKLGVNNRTAAVRVAIEQKLI